jgi:hypothetical protein
MLSVQLLAVGLGFMGVLAATAPCMGQHRSVSQPSQAHRQDRFAKVFDRQQGVNDRVSVWNGDGYQTLRHTGSARELLETFAQLIRAAGLPSHSNPAADLTWVTWRPHGWRWEEMVDKHRLILAAEDGYLVAIRVAPDGRIEMAIADNATAPHTAVYSQGVRQFTAMSAQHLSRTEPEAHQLYAYFAGPSRTIASSRALTAPSWGDLSRGSAP